MNVANAHIDKYKCNTNLVFKKWIGNYKYVN